MCASKAELRAALLPVAGRRMQDAEVYPYILGSGRRATPLSLDLLPGRGAGDSLSRASTVPCGAIWEAHGSGCVGRLHPSCSTQAGDLHPALPAWVFLWPPDKSPGRKTENALDYIRSLLRGAE